MFEIILAIAMTKHIGLEGEYNEMHPHVQVQHESGFVAGAYYNSESTGSIYAGWRFEYESAFLEVGAVTGYEAIAVAPFARAGFELGENMDVFVTPAYEASGNLGVVVGLSFKF